MATKGDFGSEFGWDPQQDWGVAPPDQPQPQPRPKPGEPGYAPPDQPFGPNPDLPPAPPPGTPGTYQAGSPNDPNRNKPDSTWWDTVGRFQAQRGGGGGGGAPQPAHMDTSAQPVSASNPSYDALNALLQQMFSAQQSRDAENAQYRGQIRGSILDRLKTVSQPKTMDSPEINAQSKAYQGASERNLRSNREALAERAHAQGLPSGAQDAGVQGAYTSARQEQSGHDAKLLGDSLKQQRDELDQLLQIGAGSITADDMSSINSYRDQIDSQLRKLSTQQAGNLGQQDINLRQLLGLGSLSLGQQGVTNQNDQFNANYGLNFGNSQWEHEYLMTLLGLRKP